MEINNSPDEDRQTLEVSRMPAWICVIFLSMCFFFAAAYQASRMSPCSDEYGHFAAGLAWWQYGDTRAFYVNPPLIRIIATAPAYFAGYRLPEEIKSARFRYEFIAGRQLFVQSPTTFQYYLFCGRLTVVTLNTLAIPLIFIVVSSLTGLTPGLFAAAMWAIQPQILSHGATIVNDIPAACAILLFLFVLGLTRLDQAILEGGLLLGTLLGLALITKFTALLLIPLLMLHAIISLFKNRSDNSKSQAFEVTASHRLWQGGFIPIIAKVSLILVVALLIINLPYAFNGVGTSIKDIEFVSEQFGGKDAHLYAPGNRFAKSWIGNIPVPISIEILQGIDRQQYDFEHGLISFAAGIRSDHGWYWFYPYAMMVKLPLGTIAIVGITFGIATFWQHTMMSLCMIATFIGLITASPYWLSSFNTLAGGFQTGPNKLTNDASDWGQELYTLSNWMDEKGRDRCVLISDFYFYEVALAVSIPILTIDEALEQQKKSDTQRLKADLIVISTTDLAFNVSFESFCEDLELVDSIGGAYRIYSVPSIPVVSSQPHP